MKITPRWEKTPPPKDRVYDPVKVNTAGYVPIAKRIDLMVRAGVKLQNTPSFYQFEGPVPDSAIAVNSVKQDLYFREKNKQDVLKKVSEDLAKKASDASQEARKALETKIIENYLKNHPAPVVAPSTPIENTTSKQ